MSDNGDNDTGAGAQTEGSGMPQSDINFLITCLKNTAGGSINVS